MKRLILMFGLLGQPVGAQEGVWLNGNDLHAWCSADTNSFSSAMCMAYVIGVMDGMRASWGYSRYLDAGSAVEAMQRPSCTPPGIIRAQARDIVAEYLKSHPAERHEDAAYLIRRAMKEAYPCE